MSQTLQNLEPMDYEGICGSPIVTEEGEVGGFFQSLSPDKVFVYAAPLDGLIKLGWEVVQE